jgi:hypothetical protein
MAKTQGKTSSRGREGPEPGPPPGGRAEQRSTREQLPDSSAGGDPATAWEREEQEHLPSRSTGSQRNQGADKQTQGEEPDERAESDAAPSSLEGEQSGGDRGSSRKPGG